METEKRKLTGGLERRERVKTLNTTSFTPNYGSLFYLPVLFLFNAFSFFTVFKKKREKIVITKALQRINDLARIPIFFLSSSSICLCHRCYYLFLCLCLPALAAFLNSHGEKEAAICIITWEARPVSVRRCTASDGGALYNRASVFTASLWVSVGCNINSTTQLYYQQENQHSPFCDLAHNYSIVQSVHTHINNGSLADTYGQLVFVMCRWLQLYCHC